MTDKPDKTLGGTTFTSSLFSWGWGSIFGSVTPNSEGQLKSTEVHLQVEGTRMLGAEMNSKGGMSSVDGCLPIGKTMVCGSTDSQKTTLFTNYAGIVSAAATFFKEKPYQKLEPTKVEVCGPFGNKGAILCGSTDGQTHGVTLFNPRVGISGSISPQTERIQGGVGVQLFRSPNSTISTEVFADTGITKWGIEPSAGIQIRGNIRF